MESKCRKVSFEGMAKLTWPAEAEFWHYDCEIFIVLLAFDSYPSDWQHPSRGSYA